VTYPSNVDLMENLSGHVEKLWTKEKKLAVSRWSRYKKTVTI